MIQLLGKSERNNYRQQFCSGDLLTKFLRNRVAHANHAHLIKTELGNQIILAKKGKGEFEFDGLNSYF